MLPRQLQESLPDGQSTLDELRGLRNAVAHYQPLVHVMGEAREDGERGAVELRTLHGSLLQVNRALSADSG